MSAVELKGVFAADALGPAGRPLGKVRDISLVWQAGLLAVEGSPADGSLALAEVLAGRRAPDRGAVSVAGRAPHRYPQLRRRIGSFLPLPGDAGAPLGRLDAWLDLALPDAADRARLPALLEQLQLGALVPAVRGDGGAQLPSAARRALDLALSLSLQAPLLLVLVEPFATLAARAPLQQLLKARAAAGCCVVVFSRDARHPLTLANERLLLQNGEIVECGVAETVGLAIELSDADSARALGARLLQHPAVQRLDVELVAGGARVTLRGRELSPLARALLAEAVAHPSVVQIQPLSASAGAAGGGARG